MNDEHQNELDKLRAENENLRQKLDGQERSANRGYRRRWLSITCAVLAAILLPAAVITVWSRNTLLDTGEYVDTIAPLADDENIQEAVSFRVTEAVAEAADFRGLAEEALPEEAQILAGPIESGAKTLIDEIAQRAVATDQFSTLWQETNEAAHERLVQLLKGEESDLVGTSDGRVVVKLGSVAVDAVERLDEQLGTSLADQIPEEDLDAELVLVDSSELADVQTAVRVFDNITWFTVLLALVFIIGAVLFAERRRLGVRRLGIAMVVSMVLGLVAYAWLRDIYLSGLPDDVHNPDAAAAVFDILTRFLQRTLRTLLVVGLLALLTAWVMGPSNSAATVRGWWDTLLGRASASGARREVGPALRTIESHERGLLVGAAVLGGLVLVLWTHPTGFVVLLVLILTLAVMAAIRLAAEVVRRSDAEEAPDDRPGEAPDDRPGGDVADATDDEPAVSDSTHT